MLSSLEMRVAFGYFTFDAAKVHGAYAQVRGYVMLRHPLYNMRAIAQQVLVALFGRIADEGEKLVHVM